MYDRFWISALKEEYIINGMEITLHQLYSVAHLKNGY